MHQNPKHSTAYKYTVVPASPLEQAITADQLRTALKIDSDTLADADANELILTAQAWAMNYAGFVLFTSEVTTYRNALFNSLGLELRRFPAMPDEPIVVEYLKDTVLTTVASTVYFLAERTFYSILFLVDGQCWPTDVDYQLDAIKITYSAGYGADATFLPRDIIAGITALAVYLYENPGDCNSCAAGSRSFPSEAARLLGYHKPLMV